MLSEEYLNNPRMSQSKLKRILDGVEEFKYYSDNPPPASDSQNLGQAVHLLLLQPHLSNFVVKLEPFNGNTRQGKIFNFLREGKSLDFFSVTEAKVKKQEKDLFYEVSQEEYDFALAQAYKYKNVFLNPKDYIILELDEFDKANRIVEAVLKNEDSVQLLKNCINTEKIYLYEYKGIEFKCQLDGIGSNYILDLKTTRIPNNDWTIIREIRNNRYHFQSASYMRAKNANFTTEPYYILWVRTEAPYAVFPIQLGYELLEEGLREFDKACDLYNYCLINNPNFIPNNRLRII